MNRHLVILSNAYFVLAALAGLPALAGSIFFGWSAVQLTLLSPKPAKGTAVTQNPNSVGDVIESTAHMVGGILGLLGDIGTGIIIGLAIVSVFVLAFAVLLLLTGRGIRAHKTWARWLAFPMMLWLGLVSLVSLASAGRTPLSLVSLAVLAGCGYAIWVLIRWFAPAPNPVPAVPFHN